MSNKNDQLVRMKELIKYGTVNEDTKPVSSYNIEHKAVAADGRCYGIIRENSKFFVKVATPGKETIAEAYQYIGGIQNKKNYEYNSYNNALKQFELKLGSINEAYDEDRRVNVETLDPFKKEDLVIEGTEKMKNELARQRQIMRNASVIMNEATEIGSTPFKTQPEAEHENSGDKDYPFTKEGKPEQDRGAIKFGEGNPDKHSSTFGPDSNDVEDYDLDKGATPKVKGSVASENPSGGKVARVNEGVEECGLAGPLPEEGEDDLDLGGGEEPETVTPEEFNGSEGLGIDLGDEEPEVGDEEGLGDDEGEIEIELGDDEEDLDDEDELGDEEDLDLGDDEDFDFEDEDEFGDDEDLDLGDDEEFDDEEDFDLDGEEEGEFGDNDEIELDENIVKQFRRLVRESIEEMAFKQHPKEWDDPDDDEELPEDEYVEDDMIFPDDDRIASWHEPIYEAKSRKMNSIVESVVRDILKEDELHVFGDHPGYRKKPFTLPQTGSDKFQVNRDWNDDSVHNEEPFGKGKGDSTPFDILVAQITDSVMKQVNEGKKKVK